MGHMQQLYTPYNLVYYPTVYLLKNVFNSSSYFNAASNATVTKFIASVQLLGTVSSHNSESI